MRLLFLNRSFPVLSQTFVLDHIAYAVARGHDTTVAALRLLKDVEHPVIDQLQLYETMLYARPVDPFNLRRVASGLIAHRERFAGAFRSRALGRAKATELSIALQIDHQPDVIIANFGPTGVSAARLKENFFPKAKVVVIFHGYDVSGYVAKHGWDVYRKMAPNVDLAVCVTERWSEPIKRETKMANVIVHHLGVRCRDMPSWQRPRRQDFSILFVGRMTEKKGFRHLIAAAAILRARNVSLHVDAVGDGPNLASYKAEIAKQGLTDAFTFHGARTHGFVLDLMSKADCLVAPSITAEGGDQEGIPVVLMEAMAIGTPVVSTRHSGIPELIEAEKSGLLVDEKDDSGFADCIERLARNPAMSSDLSTAARGRVRESFDAEAQNRKLFEMIEGL
jgi:colanic acid/amylovoran biosynthesis glycosyltransferase